MKNEIIKEIADLLKMSDNESVNFVFSQFTVTRDNDKVDVMGLYLTDDGNVEVECIPYSNWSIKYYNLKTFGYKSIKKIYNETLKKFDE